MFGNNKNNMHPDDRRNLIIFCAVTTAIFLLYNAFILAPQRAAREYQKKHEMEIVIDSLEATKVPELLRPRAEVLGDNPRVIIDSPTVRGSIALRGGRLDDIALKEYFVALDKKENVVVLSPRETDMPRYIDYGWVGGKNTAVPDENTLWQATGNTTLNVDNPVVLRWDNGQGLVFERRYSIDKNYMIDVTQHVQNNSSKSVTLHTYGMIVQRGIPKDMIRNWLQHEGPMGYIGSHLHEIPYTRFHKEGALNVSASQGWTGITEKYWMTALIPPQGEEIKYSYSYNGVQPAKGQSVTGLYQADFTGPAVSIAPGASIESTSHIFAGPKKVLLLDEYEEKLKIPHFDLAVNFGWFWFFSKPFFLALHYLGEATGNFGLAIILMTIGIRMMVFPLTNASYRSFAKMKKVTPQIGQLREIHGDNKADLQKGIMELYQREGVNPMAGCLPILVQIPIFFALYKVLFVTIEMRHAPFFGWIQDLSAADPTTIFNLFGLFDWQPPKAMQIGVWPCLMLVATLIQKKLNPPPQDPIQRDMANYFPFIITYIMAGFSSGLVIYWTIGAYIGVIQQIVIMRGLGVPIHLFGQTDEEAALEKKVDQGPAVHPLAQMAEDKVEDALFGELGDDVPPSTVSPPKPRKKKKR